MQSLHNILKTFVKEYGLEGGVVLNSIQNQWKNIAGQTVAAHTFPDTIKGKVLTLIVDTPQWLHHLSFLKEEIISKLKSYNVIEVRFKLGKLPENTKETRLAGDITLSEDDMIYLENTLRNLKDEDLREKFRKLIAHGLMRGRK
jgi:hypothetical protein